MSCLNALFDESLGQSICDIGRNTAVARVADNTNNATSSRRHDCDLVFHDIGSLVNVGRRCRTRTGEPAELLPEARGTLEFLSCFQMELLDNLFHESTLLQNFSLRLHVNPA